jgi:DNA-binding Lrp family transcriptional regulator
MLSKVLKLLEDDSRLTPEQIATMLDTDAEKIKQLISQAENDGLILKYKAVINWDKITDEQVWALIEVRATPQMKAGFDAVAKQICQFPQARTVMLVSGTYDLAIVVTANTIHEISDFVTRYLAPIEGVEATTTHFLLKRYKEDGVVLDDTNKEMRQKVVL